MKYIPSSSFTPGESPSTIPKMVQRKRTFHIFGFIATLMLICSLVAAVGSFLYKQNLNKQLTEAKNSLLKVSTVDNDTKIQEIGAFDSRLKTAKYLLDNHIAPSKVFAELEAITKKTVQYIDLKYSYDPGFEVALEVGGSTSEFLSVLQQKIKFQDEKQFSVLVVHNINASIVDPTKDQKSTDPKEKKVLFGVKGLLRKELFAYTGDSADQVKEATTTLTETPVIPVGTTTHADSSSNASGTVDIIQ